MQLLEEREIMWQQASYKYQTRFIRKATGDKV